MFPELDEEQLRNLTCGTYQLKMSSSYAQEHIDGNCTIQIHSENDGLLRVKLQSRHVSSRCYQVWIKYDFANVLAWYCKCRAGARVVGVCSHIAAVVWFLGYARHQQNRKYGVRDWGVSVTDAADIPVEIDSSESEEEEEFVEE